MLKLVVFVVVFLITLEILSIAVYLNAHDYYKEEIEERERNEK